MSPVDVSQLEAIRAAAKKKFGEETIHNGSIMPPVYKVPFDSIELNLATFGGAPMGRMLQLWGGPSSGKALHIDTPIATPSGWSAMGDLKIGDHVFDGSGTPTRISFVSSIMLGNQCYEVVFDDGSTILADAEHLWTVESYQSRKSRYRWALHDYSGGPKSRDQSHLMVAGTTTMTTEEMARSVVLADGRRNYTIDNCAPLDLPRAELPIDPYVVGVWLGDGSSREGQVFTDDPEIVDQIGACGYKTKKLKPKFQYAIYGLYRQLRLAGLLQNKHIPNEYLRSSFDQRLALLQGLMDTDGEATKTGNCILSSSNMRLMMNAYELCCSLGIKSAVSERRAMLNGKDCGPTWRLSFTTDLNVFRLTRKRIQHSTMRSATSHTHKRYTKRSIVEIRKTASVPVRCIEVESESHLFLAGRQMVPTHNTMSAWGLVKMAQQVKDEFFPDGLHATYYNVEGTYDPIFTQQLGVDTDRIEIIDCNVIEDIGRHVEAMFLASHIHIIDSTSFAESELEVKADLGDSRPAADARAWKQVLRRLERKMDKGDPSDGDKPARPGDNMVIMISHETVDFQTKATKAVSGKTIGHASSMSLHYRQAKKLYRSAPGEKLTEIRPQKGNDPLTGGHKINGAEIEIEVNKSKVCRPFGKARRTLDYDTLQFDNAAEMFKSGVFLGVIEKSGNFYKFPGHEKSINGAAAAAEFIANDITTVSAIIRASQEYFKTGGVREVGQ